MNKIINLLAGLLLFFSFQRVDVIQEHFGATAYLDLKKGNSVGQTFIARHNNLSMIQFLDAVDSKLRNKDKLVFRLREYSKEEEQGEDVIRLELSGANVGTHRKLQLKFPPIAGSLNKKYYFYLENLGDEKFPEIINDSVIRVAYSEKDRYKDGRLIYNHKLLPGDLAFRTFYQVPPQKIILEVGRDFLTRFWEDRFFLLFYLSLIGILLWMISKKGKI